MERKEYKIEYNNRELVYNYSIITLEQTTAVVALLEFRNMQIEHPAKTFTDIIRSGGIDWFLLLGAFLFREKKDNKILDFDKDSAIDEIVSFIKKIPSELCENVIAEAANDFFTNSGRAAQFSSALRGEKNLNANQLIQSLLEKQAIMQNVRKSF